jgi:hypothetical protein
MYVVGYVLSYGPYLVPGTKSTVPLVLASLLFQLARSLVYACVQTEGQKNCTALVRRLCRLEYHRLPAPSERSQLACRVQYRQARYRSVDLPEGRPPIPQDYANTGVAAPGVSPRNPQGAN